MEKRKYEILDGYRAYAAIGIILMHIRGNGRFGFSGFFYDRIIASFTNLTFFFMLLSAFSMCCGYYEKFKNNSINIEQFYKRRYERIWPYFALLCTIELIVDHNLNSLFEWFADITLVFGLLPNENITVVGVGWFIGIIFVFYIMFPFFVFLIANKKRAWAVFFVTIIINILCQKYFFDSNHMIDGFCERTNILYSSIFFVAGGLIYLYRDIIKEQVMKYKWIFILFIIGTILFYYAVNSSVFTMVVLFSLFICVGLITNNLSSAIFNNKVICFLSSISMEVYLCHMFVYRVVEKLRWLHLSEFEIINYGLVSMITITGAIVMAFVLKKAIEIVGSKYRKNDGVKHENPNG